MPKKNDIIVTYLNNQECLLHYSGVIFIPKIKAIIISDIHFEKASALNIKKISTIPLPSFDTHEILITLNKIFKIFDPKKIIFLGDTFHNLISAEYISEKYKKNIKNIINEFECIWIKGNHDVNKPSWLNVSPIDEHEEIGIVFRHITKFEDNEMYRLIRIIPLVVLSYSQFLFWEQEWGLSVILTEWLLGLNSF